VRYADKINSGQFLFLTYDDLIDNPQRTIEKIYTHFQWDNFNHNYDNIINNNPEPDFLINMSGLHTIRETIGRRQIDITLSTELYEKAINTSIFGGINDYSSHRSAW